MALVEDHHRRGVLRAVEDAARLVVVQDALCIRGKLATQLVHLADHALDAGR